MMFIRVCLYFLNRDLPEHALGARGFLFCLAATVSGEAAIVNERKILVSTINNEDCMQTVKQSWQLAKLKSCAN